MGSIFRKSNLQCQQQIENSNFVRIVTSKHEMQCDAAVVLHLASYDASETGHTHFYKQVKYRLNGIRMQFLSHLIADEVAKI